MPLTQVLRSTSLPSAASSLEPAGYYNLSQKGLKLNQQKVKVDVLESENATTTPSVSRPGYYGPFQERGAEAQAQAL